MPPSTEFIRHGKYKRATLERVFPVPTLNVTGFHGKPVMQRRPICRRQILHGPMFNLCMEALTRTRFGINRVSVIDGRRCGSVRLANVHKLGAEINVNLKRAEMRYQTNQQFDACSAIHPRRIPAAGRVARKSVWEVLVNYYQYIEINYLRLYQK